MVRVSTKSCVNNQSTQLSIGQNISEVGYTMFPLGWDIVMHFIGFSEFQKDAWKSQEAEVINLL